MSELRASLITHSPPQHPDFPGSSMGKNFSALLKYFSEYKVKMQPYMVVGTHNAFLMLSGRLWSWRLTQVTHGGCVLKQPKSKGGISQLPVTNTPKPN